MLLNISFIKSISLQGGICDAPGISQESVMVVVKSPQLPDAAVAKAVLVSRGSEKATTKEVARRCKRALTLLERTCSGCCWHFPYHRHGWICHKWMQQRFLLCPSHAYPAQWETLLHERIRKPRLLGEGQPAHWGSKKGLRETSWNFSRLKQMLFKSDVPVCLTFPNGCKGHSLLCLQLDHFQCHQLAVDPVRSQ